MRRGRPSIVRQEGEDFLVNVQGTGYTFHRSADGRLRPTGKTREWTGTDDYGYAIQRIKTFIAAAK